MRTIVAHKWKIAFGCSLLLFWFSIPKQLFHDPCSTVIEDTNGSLLGAKIATDGQWRFPLLDSVPNRFATCITLFEDEYFNSHIGINPVSFARAMKQNIAAGMVVSGGSTLTMQVVRLSRKGKGRTYFEKIIEVVQALRIELTYSKAEILAMYATYAPFGGNVVGVNTASWRYYGRPAYKLSWSEAATLAVLPNAPSLIYPGKNQIKLLKKRNKLLDKLVEKDIIDAFTADLAKSEPLPGKPKRLPNSASHLMQRIMKEGGAEQRNIVAINKYLQEALVEVLDRHHAILSQNEIHNAAVLVLDVKNNKVISYLGNTNCPKPQSGRAVDVITAPRSTGSILKPFLYSAAIEDGLILPHSLLPDIPVSISGYHPKNFNRKFDGVAPASSALVRSLNVPNVKLLQEYGLERFHNKLQELKIKDINKGPNHYGLTLILGGAEASLWDLCRSYKGMAQTLNNFMENSSKYKRSDYDEPQLLLVENEETKEKLSSHSVFTASAIWQTFETLTAVSRPNQEGAWELFSTSRKVAWKTGTSFGHRDGWAIGVTPEYVVGVWVGNADGEGRPGLTGVNSAAPLMFDVFNKMPKTTWFDVPYDELAQIPTCAKSGNRAGANCEAVDTVLTASSCLKVKACDNHKLVHLNKDKTNRVTSACYAVEDMVATKWFTLSPSKEWYYKRLNPHYKSLPPMLAACLSENESRIELIYPKNTSKLFIPKDLEGKLQRIVFEAATNQQGVLYWHLDDEFVGETDIKHTQEILTTPGWHRITIVDAVGNTLAKSFEFLEE
jgi:penicillin-binding protein 1C